MTKGDPIPNFESFMVFYSRPVRVRAHCFFHSVTKQNRNFFYQLNKIESDLVQKRGESLVSVTVNTDH